MGSGAMAKGPKLPRPSSTPPSATSTAVFRRSAAMAGLSEIADYARVGQDRNDSGNLPRERDDWYDVRMFA